MIKKPTILIIFNSYLNKGGEESVVQNELKTLTKYGYKYFYKEYNNLSYQKFGIGTLFLPLNIFFNFSAFFHTFLFVIRNKIDVVHVHNVFFTISPSVFWGAKLAGAKTVYTVHNYRLFCLDGTFFLNGKICTHCYDTNSFSKGIKNKCFKKSHLFSFVLASSMVLHRFLGSWRLRVDQYVAINPFLVELLIQKGIDAKKINLKPNYSKDFGFENYLNRENFYFFAGRLQAEKGIQHLVEAFSLLKKNLVIAGKGDLLGWLEKNSTASIKYIGQQSVDEMQQLYLKCKAVVFPSIWFEGLPMAIIEAQSAGVVPIVASTETTRAMIDEGENGFLYEAGDAASLVEAVNEFEKKSVEELNVMSNNARTKFKLKYEEEQHIWMMDKIYNKN